MSKIYSAIALLFATLGLCVTENIFINNSTEKAKNQISEIQKNVENNRMSVALNIAKNLKDGWKDDMNVLGMLCDHRDIDKIEEYIDLIEMTLAKPEYDESFWEESTKATLQLEDLRENQDISLVNIL